jgi:hypothetical protein
MQQTVLNSVTCNASTDCWAVGNYVSSTSTFETLIEHYDGAAWTIVSSPNPSGSRGSLLNGVTCVSSNDCWAVGYYYTGNVYQTLIERNTGNGWIIVASPNTSDTQTNILQAVTCTSEANCWAVGYYVTDGNLDQTLIEHYSVAPVQLMAAVSRKTHGSTGIFDVDLTNGSGIECRSGGTNGAYTVVFTFANPLANVAGASVTGGSGSVATANIDNNDTHNYIVNLTGVTNAQRITVSLSNVTDTAGDFSNALSASMGVLIGDVNSSGRVDAADVSLVRQQSLQPVSSSNFRADINASGRIDAADVSIARQQTLTSLP